MLKHISFKNDHNITITGWTTQMNKCFDLPILFMKLLLTLLHQLKQLLLSTSKLLFFHLFCCRF